MQEIGVMLMRGRIAAIPEMPVPEIFQIAMEAGAQVAELNSRALVVAIYIAYDSRFAKPGGEAIQIRGALR
jgi:hypothetical protein